MKRFLLSLFFLPLYLSAEFFFFSPEMINSHIKNYTSEEMLLIEKDFETVRSVCLKEELNLSKPLYIATAGGPGARKSTILERFMQDNKSSLPILTYLDPDTRCLKFLAHTYQALSLNPLSYSQSQDFTLVQKKAYDKWRGASNYITVRLLEEAFLKHLSIAHGTTSTGDHIVDFLPKIKSANYDITLLLCFCEDDFRFKAIQYRNEEQKFYQSTPEDAVIKGKMFPVRMSTYFTYANTLYLFWSDDLSTQEKLAALLNQGKLDILDSEAYQKIINKYEKDRANLKKEGKIIPSWEKLLQLYTNK